MDIVAVPGRQVRDPATRRVVDQTPLSIDPTDLYWARLLDDGDVTEAPAPASEPDDDVADAPEPAPAKGSRSQEKAS